MSLLRLYMLEGAAPGEDDLDWNQAEETWPECSVAWDRDVHGQEASRITPVGGMLFVLSAGKWYWYDDRDAITGRARPQSAGDWLPFDMNGIFSLLSALSRSDKGVRFGQNMAGTLDVRPARSSVSLQDYAAFRFSRGATVPVVSTFPIKPIEGLRLSQTGSQARAAGGNRINTFEADFDPEVVAYVVRAVSDRGDKGRSEWGQDNLD